MAKLEYNLGYAWELRDFFIAKQKDQYQHNLFYYPERNKWLSTCSKVVELQKKLLSSIQEAKSDEAQISKRIDDAAWPFAKLLLDDIVLGAKLKAYGGQIHPTMLEIPMPSEIKVALSGNWEKGDPKTIEAYIKAWSSYRREYEKDVAKVCIKDMAVMWMPYRGVQRKLLRLEHNFSVTDNMFVEKLYIPAVVIRAAVLDAVFKGAWNKSMQKAFNDIYKITVADRTGWSQQARNAMGEWKQILTDYKYVSDNVGKKFLEIVEIVIHQGGGVAA